MSRPALILNPRARRFRRAPRLLDDVRAMARGAAVVHVPETLNALDEVAAAVLRDRAPLVVLAGGDGTFMATLSALARQAGSLPLPKIALAPAGTVATIARNLGATAGLLEVVERARRWPSDGTVTARPTLAVSEAEGAQRLGFIAGTGLVARFFEAYEAAGANGYDTALDIALRVFLGSFSGNRVAREILSPLPCRVLVGDRPLAPHAWSLVVCSVLRDLGLGMRVTYRGGEDPARPHLVASPLSPSRLGPQWPLVALGRPLLGRDNFDGLVPSFTVDFGERPGPYVLDGDTFHSRCVTVRAGPIIDVVTYGRRRPAAVNSGSA